MKTDKAYLEIISNQYDEIATVWDQFPISAKKNAEYFVKSRPTLNHRALDLGCGTGRVAKLLSPYFTEVYGIDISPGMIKHAKEMCSKTSNTTFEILDAREMDYEDGYFDYVVSHTTLHHLTLEDQKVVLGEIKNILRPGGKLVIIEIVAKGLMRKYPHIVRRIGASITLLIELLRFKKDSFERYKVATHPTWMNHLKMDRFLTPKKFRDLYGSVFTGASIKSIKREFLLNNEVVLEWVKPS